MQERYVKFETTKMILGIILNTQTWRKTFKVVFSHYLHKLN
jgi:hypothetical protein